MTDVWTTDRNPWRNYQATLRSLLASDATHGVVLQDDVVVCRNFAPAVEQIAQANPDTPVCLFLGGLPQRTGRNALRAAKMGYSYCDVYFRDFCPVVAMLWPKHKAQEFMDWAGEAPSLPGYLHPRSDDAVVGRWMVATKQLIRATVPSLVEHEDMVPSLIGRPARFGKDRGRVARMFIGDADPLQIDWS